MSNMYIHFIDNFDGKVVKKGLQSVVPRVGDTVRLSIKQDDIVFYKVIEVCFVFDEPLCPYERVNVGLEAIGYGYDQAHS